MYATDVDKFFVVKHLPSVLVCHFVANVSPTQTLCLGTAPTSKSKGALHNRDESFSSSIQSNDSVFTDTDLSNSLQTSSSAAMGSSQGKLFVEGSETVFCEVPTGDREAEGKVVLRKVDKKRSPKESGYGSRLNTDDLQSPSHSSSDKSSPKCIASPAQGDTIALVVTKTDSDDGSCIRILTLANSPVLVNKSYRQFYYVDDLSLPSKGAQPLAQPSTEKSRTPTRGKYPKQPILPQMGQSMSAHKQLTVKSIKAIKSASCSSLDQLSLTSSLEDYASNLAKGASGEEAVGGNEAGTRERLLSVTHFETLSGNLETPQCATIVQVAGSSASSLDAEQKKKHRKHLLSRLYIRRRKAKAAEKLTNTSDRTPGVVVTPAGQAQLRKKKRENRGKRRMVVSDDLTHKVNFEIGSRDSHQPNTAENSSTPTVKPSETETRRKKKKSEVKGKRSETKREKKLCHSAEHATPRAGMYFVRENHILPFSAELSQSLDGGLSDLKHLELQLKKLAQPSQSTTQLDLSQRVIETAATLGLRVSHSVDDLTDPNGVTLSQTSEASSDEPPREGFLWRVLGRASQRWPAFIHIVAIQSSQSGMSGFGVRKGQSVRALYRVSGQVIVETETNHMACIPYECCRISRKYYGQNSLLVQLSYSQVYIPIRDPPSTHSSSLHSSSAAAPSQAKHQYINAPIEMMAIQDNYDCLPVGEINVDAGEKLRVLYCDDRLVYAVKENGEAGLLARNFCRLTRRSEKMYQKWVELTRSPFQADYPVRFGKKAPTFLSDGTLSELKEIRSKPTTPEAQKKLRITSTTSTHSEAASSKRNTGHPGPVHSAPKSGIPRAYKPLPPTPPGKRRENQVSPLVQNGLRSPVRQPSSLHHRMTSPAAVVVSPRSSLPPSPSLKSPVEMPIGVAALPESNQGPSKYREGKAVENTTQPPGSTALAKSKSTPVSVREGSTAQLAKVLSDRATSRQQPFSYSGKLMTVVQNYTPHVGRAESMVRKGLRVRVVRSSPDGKTLRVATKTGTQFDIPVSHLCMSRRNSEPSLSGDEIEKLNLNHIAVVPDSISTTIQKAEPKVRKSPPIWSPPPNLPLECGKIMTVIRNFVPTPDDPMVTIRRGLRVKVLGGHANQVKVITKTGTTFHIPRSHLRLSHKNSDASAFGDVERGARSPPKSAPPHSSASRNSDATEYTGVFQELLQRAPRTNSKNGSKQVLAKKHISTSSSFNGGSHPLSAAPLQNGFHSNESTGGAPTEMSPDSIRRGCRVNSTGSQVFELC